MKPNMTRSFMVLLLLAVAIGVGIGGIFAGGVALGKSSGNDPTPLSPGGPAANATDGPGQGRLNSGQGGQVRPGFLPGRTGQADPSVPGPQSRGPASGDAPVQSFPGRGGVTGTVEKVDGSLLTITTAEGPVEVMVAEDTAITRISESSAADLQPGVRVTVMGPTGEAGRVEAANLVITPEGLEGPFGRGQGYRRGAEAP